MWNLVEPQVLTLEPLCGTLWNLNFREWNLYAEPCRTWSKVSGGCPKQPRTFIGRTPSFQAVGEKLHVGHAHQLHTLHNFEPQTPPAWPTKRKSSAKSLGSSTPYLRMPYAVSVRRAPQSILLPATYCQLKCQVGTENNVLNENQDCRIECARITNHSKKMLQARQSAFNNSVDPSPSISSNKGIFCKWTPLLPKYSYLLPSG